MKCYLINLPKECDCALHDGPHWLHVDQLQFELNLRLISRRSSVLAFKAFAEAEAQRLHEKAHELSKLVKYETAPFELPEGYRERDYEARRREVMHHIWGIPAE